MRLSSAKVGNFALIVVYLIAQRTRQYADKNVERAIKKRRARKRDRFERSWHAEYSWKNSTTPQVKRKKCIEARRRSSKAFSITYTHACRRNLFLDIIDLWILQMYIPETKERKY